MKVLIAEDDPVSRRLLQTSLERWGHEVVTSNDGAEAWDRFQADRFDVVISEWMMPGLDGLELIQRIRAGRQDGYVYAILLTARARTEDLVQAMEAGADDFVAKPFDLEELRVRLRAGERVINLERALVDQNRALRDAEAKLRKHAEDLSARLGRVMDESPNEIYVFDAETFHFVQMNHSACRAIGYTFTDLREMTPLDIEPEFTQDRFRAFLDYIRGREQPTIFQTIHRRKDGDEYPVEVRIQFSQSETPPVFVAIAQDISERSRADHELGTALKQMMQAEVSKKEFFSGVIAAVTNGKFHLTEADDIPVEGPLVMDKPLTDHWRSSAIRREVLERAEAAGMSTDTATDLLLAVTEAATNAIKHAKRGRFRLYLAPDRLIARITDNGKGIRIEDLPSAILLPGFSTKVSLGVGFTLMVRMVDRLWLATSEEGTTLQMEKYIEPQPQETSPMAAALDRF